MTWAWAFLFGIIFVSTFTLSGAIRFAAERVAGAIDTNSTTLAIQNVIYMAQMDDETYADATAAVTNYLNKQNELACLDPECAVHNTGGAA